MSIYIKLSTNKNANALQGLIDIIEEQDINSGEHQDAIIELLKDDGIDFEVTE